jgi:hypothetical protein
MAAEPTPANGEAASIVTDPTRPETVALADGNGSAELPDGDVGLPPQADARPPTATIEAA